jgi:hypothetical protein
LSNNIENAVVGRLERKITLTSVVTLNSIFVSMRMFLAHRERGTTDEHGNGTGGYFAELAR